ncbi:hypothetical protein C7S16_0123 [Burkholderia thailandensis]|uniref:Uncharacterized protein n=1 Tax=Burkholderia thailandensis TaxID=57975 RepID=A0AAW9D0D2_BURTH|nr:hypothetical protein [Burkholderia thailandensis]MDW9254818.1 hypothetical protein [Burkholderia thailandensis]
MGTRAAPQTGVAPAKRAAAHACGPLADRPLARAEAHFSFSDRRR